MNFEGSFLNQTIVITGATSDVGSTITKAFFELGGNVILCDHPNSNIEMDKLKETLKEIQTNNGTTQTIDTILFDLSKLDELKRFKDLSANVLINCAGINIFKPMMDVTEDMWDEIIDVNLKGAFFLTQHICSNMIKKNIEGRVINIGSQHGVVANGLRAPYCISKFGLVGLTKVAALELSQHKILVNCVSPTFIMTNKSKEFLSHKDVQKAYLSKIPLTKFAVPTDISNLVLFLASKYNTMITGENILVDGGYTIH